MPVDTTLWIVGEQVDDCRGQFDSEHNLRMRLFGEISRRGRAYHPVYIPRAVDGDERQRVRRQPGFVNHLCRHKVEPTRTYLQPLPSCASTAMPFYLGEW